MDKSIILFLILAVIVGVFALANGNRVIIDFIFTELEISQAMVIIISALFSATIIFIIGLIRSISYRREIKELKKELDKISTENTQLKSDLDKTKKELKISEESFVALKDLE